jgi:hypothetical protein
LNAKLCDICELLDVLLPELFDLRPDLAMPPLPMPPLHVATELNSATALSSQGYSMFSSADFELIGVGVSSKVSSESRFSMIPAACRALKGTGAIAPACIGDEDADADAAL